MAKVLEPLMRDEFNVGFREIFEIRKVNNTPLRGNLARRDPGLPGLISCTMPFTLANGTSFVAIGCSEGIWVADPHNPDFMHRVMDLKGVTEFAIIEAYSLLLVLADKVIHCYTLDALDPFNTLARISQKLTPTAVDFFRIGLWDGHLAIIYKKKAMTNSVFRVIEPLFGRPPTTATDAVVAELGPDLVYWFRMEKEFYVPTDCTDVVFLTSTIAVLHPLGFEIVDIHSLDTMTIPDKDDVLRSKALAKRAKGSKPLGLFRSSRDGSILLCYSTFGLFVTRHGDPLPSATDQTQPEAQPPQIIDWHGTVYAAVPVSPYIVLFKARSIEVRCGTTGRLEQVLFGNGMRCAWRGPGILQGELELDLEEAVPAACEGKSRLQIVMNAPHGMGSDEVAQHIYDLVPVSTAHDLQQPQ